MDPAMIMIVEDNTMVAEDCRDCLESLGYSVSAIVASGEESIERAAADQPDAVLMDIQLRDNMDGIDAAEQIHARFEIPVVFLSAYSDRRLLERAKRVGSFGYLVKPFEEHELCATLEMALYKAKAEKERRQLEMQLYQAQKMKTIGTLAGGIAHKFNNNLSVITGAIDLLKMNFPDNEIIEHFTSEMKASALRMAQLSAQLLAYARGGKFRVKMVSLSDFIIDKLHMFKAILGSEIQVETDLSADIYVNADLAQMQMALSAVLSNASEAMEGKGNIRIICRRKIISETTARKFPGFNPGDYACLIITDDGIGMDEETRKRVFEPFFTTKFTGRGLGMSAVYGFVKNHDGYITVDSELGRGTTVSIYLPAN